MNFACESGAWTRAASRGWGQERIQRKKKPQGEFISSLSLTHRHSHARTQLTDSTPSSPPPLFHSHGGQKFSSHFLLPPSVFPLSEWQWRLQAATIIVNESYSRKVDNENDFQLFAVLKLLYSRNRIMLILSPLTVCWRVCRYKRRPSARASLLTFNLFPLCLPRSLRRQKTPVYSTMAVGRLAVRDSDDCRNDWGHEGRGEFNSVEHTGFSHFLLFAATQTSSFFHASFICRCKEAINSNRMRVCLDSYLWQVTGYR